MGKLSCTVVAVTQEDAKRIRATCHYDRQRLITDRNIRRLGFELTAGRFVDGTPIFFCRLPDGKLYIVNGNHTLEAIATTGVTQRLVFIILEVPDLEEVARIYGTMDVHKARTWADALRAVGLADEVVNARRVMPALGVILARFEYINNAIEAATSRAVRFSLMDHYGDEAAMIQGAISGAPTSNQRAVQRAAVMAVALETFKYQPIAALEFWRGMAQDDGLAKNDPRKALLRWLHNNTLGGQAAWPPQSRAAAHAWAAFNRKEPLTIIRQSAAASFILVGTPWQGKGKIPELIRNAIPPREEMEPAVPADPVPGAAKVSDLLDIGLFATPAGLETVAYGKP
jgi:hypothetical protein